MGQSFENLIIFYETGGRLGKKSLVELRLSTGMRSRKKKEKQVSFLENDVE